jgi:hypothetical protein
VDGSTLRTYGDLSQAYRTLSPKSPFDVPPERLPVTSSPPVNDVLGAARV